MKLFSICTYYTVNNSDHMVYSDRMVYRLAYLTRNQEDRGSSPRAAVETLGKFLHTNCLCSPSCISGYLDVSQLANCILGSSSSCSAVVQYSAIGFMAGRASDEGKRAHRQNQSPTLWAQHRPHIKSGIRCRQRRRRRRR